MVSAAGRVPGPPRAPSNLPCRAGPWQRAADRACTDRWRQARGQSARACPRRRPSPPQFARPTVVPRARSRRRAGSAIAVRLLRRACWALARGGLSRLDRIRVRAGRARGFGAIGWTGGGVHSSASPPPALPARRDSSLVVCPASSRYTVLPVRPRTVQYACAPASKAPPHRLWLVDAAQHPLPAPAPGSGSVVSSSAGITSSSSSRLSGRSRRPPWRTGHPLPTRAAAAARRRGCGRRPSTSHGRGRPASHRSSASTTTAATPRSAPPPARPAACWRSTTRAPTRRPSRPRRSTRARATRRGP